MNVLYAQLAGIIAMLLVIFSVQCRKKKHILLVQMIANIFYSLQYSLLFAYEALFPCLIAVLRNFIFYQYDKKRKKIPLKAVIFILSLVLIFAYLTYRNVLSFIPLIISISYTIGASHKNPRVFKYVFGICGFIWILYNLQVQAYVGILNNIMEIVSATVAITREKKIEKKRAERRLKREASKRRILTKK